MKWLKAKGERWTAFVKADAVIGVKCEIAQNAQGKWVGFVVLRLSEGSDVTYHRTEPYDSWLAALENAEIVASDLVVELIAEERRERR